MERAVGLDEPGPALRQFGGGHPYEDRTDLPMRAVTAGRPVYIIVEYEEGDE